MSKYEAVYFVGDNQVSNRIRVDSYKTRNRGAFSGSLAALPQTNVPTKCQHPTPYNFQDIAQIIFYRSRSQRQGQRSNQGYTMKLNIYKS